MGNVIGAAGVIFVLMGLGYLARRWGVLQANDERVLNALVYYFSLPAYLFLELSRAEFSGRTVRFLAAGGLPLFLVVLFLAGLRLLGVPRGCFYLLSVSTVFGSLAFFGIPFLEYAVGGEEAARLAALAVGLLAPFGVGFVLTLLELHREDGLHGAQAVRRTAGRLAQNPLILSIALGIAVGALRWELPHFVLQILRYLSSAVAPVALFSLGAFLYGRSYRAIRLAIPLSLLRLLLLPAITALFSWLLGLSPLEATVAVVMNGTPLAVNMIVLSQRYDFFVEEMASLTLVSSLGSLATLSFWRFVLVSWFR